MSMAQANQQAAAFTASATSDATVVPLTGNDDADWAAVEAAATALHESVDSGSPDLVYTTDQKGFLAFSAPGLLQERLESSDNILAAQCNSGNVGQRRRADGTISTMNAAGGTRVEWKVTYKRTSCARWTITKIEMTPVVPFTTRTWFRNFFYLDGAWLGDRYGNRDAGKQCRTLLYNETHRFDPQWQIQAKHRAKIELIDNNPNLPGNVVSCQWGAGTSYTSGWFALPGGVK